MYGLSNLLTKFQQNRHWLATSFLTPDQKYRLLYNVLRGVGFLAGVYILVVILVGDATARNHLPLVFSFLFLVCIAAVLTLYGYQEKAGWFFTSAVWILMSVYSWSQGGVHSLLVVNYIVPILLAGLLVNLSWALTLIAITTIWTVLLTLLEEQTPWVPLHTTYTHRELVVVNFIRLSLVGLCLYWLYYYWQVALEEAQTNQQRANLSEARYQQMLETSQAGVILFDAVGKITFANSNLAAIFGYTPQELIGTMIHGLTSPQYHEELNQRLLAHATGKLEAAEVLVNRRDGSPLWINYSSHPLYDPLGNISGSLVMVTDVTAAKHQAKQLAQMEASFRLLFTHNPSPMWVFALDSLRFLAVNEAAQEKYGYTEAEFLSMTILDIRPPEQIPLVVEVIKDNLGAAAGNPWKHCLKNGDIIDVEVHSQKLEFLGQVASLVVARDVTAELQVEAIRQENQQLLAQLETETELRKLKGRFIAMVTHDFRNPLATMKLSASSVLHNREKMPPERLEKKVTTILEQVDRLDGMLEDLLTLGESETKNLNFRPQLGDFAAFCQQMVENYQALTPSHTIEYEQGVNSLELTFDRKLMERVLNNLLSNAVKYSPNEKLIQVKLNQEGDTIILSVKDHGIGVPPEGLANLFEPFYRATNVRDIKGTGLGLAIVKQIIELHGGTITAHSEPQQGTVFNLSFPLYPNRA